MTIKNEISMGNACELIPIMLNRKTDRKEFFYYLFIQYFKRVKPLAVIAILPCGPLCKHINIYTNTIHNEN